MSKTFFDWEARPAVMLNDGRVVAVVRPDGNWSELTEQSARDVLENAAMLSPDEFADRFPLANLAALREIDNPGKIGYLK